MRGDSRLDLYAKLMAVIGLGLVGTVGAVIDYWPGPVRMPHVDAANVRRAVPVVQTLVDMRGLEFDAAGPRIASVPAAAHVEHAALGGAPAHRMPHVAQGEWLEETGVAGISDGAPAQVIADLLLPSFSYSSTFPPVHLTSNATSAAPRHLFEEGSALAPRQPMASAETLDQSEEGFLSGMLKKTGSSVTSSLGKASNSFVGAVRAVGGAVKKAF